MIRNTLQKLPVYLLLAPLFFVWHVYNEYFGYIYLQYPAFYFMVFLSASLGLFGLGWLLIRHVRAAGIWAAVILLPYLFWAPFHDFLKSLPLPPRLSSYTILLSLYFLGIIAGFFFLRKKKPGLTQVTFFLNLLFIVFIGLEIFNTGYKAGSGQLTQLDIGKNKTTAHLLPIPSRPVVAPDIFFVVFDEYASSRSLATYLNFDNSAIDTLLTHNNFFVADKSKSNYNSTPHSLAATLNLNFLQADLEGSPSDPRHILEAQYAYERSFLPCMLDSLDYRIVNLGLMDFVNHPSTGPSFFDRDMDAVFLNETMGYRIYWQIWWNFTERWTWLRKSAKEKARRQQEVIQRNLINLSGLMTELKTQDSRPKFVMTHAMLPHRPFYVDSNGRARFIDNDYSLPEDSLYLDQVKYTNTWISQIAQAANRPFDRPRVVIVAGDHGKRDNELPISSRPRDKQFMNLAAYYFSDGRDSLFYPSITPVNSFRIILNNYFNTTLPLLPDSCIMIQ